MTNFKVNFEHPWFLLLLIPAIALPLFSYFKLNKRYRFTRNRITSLVLHLTVMVLSIAVLTGLSFSYYVPNTDNEVILLVDASYSNSEDSQDKTDDFIKEVIATTDSKFNLGIVTSATIRYTHQGSAQTQRELTQTTFRLRSPILRLPT